MNLRTLVETYNIDENLLERFGIGVDMELFPPQVSAINQGVLTGSSLLLVSNASTGKTLIAELALATICEGCSAYLVPNRALAEEKYSDMKERYGDYYSIAISTSDHAESDSNLENFRIVIATFEKAEILIRTCEAWKRQLKLVIVDEFDYIGTNGRGPDLEFLITLLKQQVPEIQLICLSAVIGNPSEIHAWLGEDFELVYDPDFRPVPLTYGTLLGQEITYYNEDGTTRNSETIDVETRDPLHSLILKKIEQDETVICFCPTRSMTDQMAQRLERAARTRELVQNGEELANLTREFYIEHSTEIEPNQDLLRSIQDGIAFYHAGLSLQERNFVMKLFTQQKIRVIMATTAIAEGVNTPASLVVFSALKAGETPIEVNQFKNMAGRAGRAGFRNRGECIIRVMDGREQEDVRSRYILSDPRPVDSKLMYLKSLRTNMNILLSTGTISSEEDLLEFFKQTFFGFKLSGNLPEEQIRRILRFLQENEFVTEFAPTKLGTIAAIHRFDPETVLWLFEGLNLLQQKIDREVSSENIDELTFLHLVVSTSDFSENLRPTPERYLSSYSDEQEQARQHLLPYLIEEPRTAANIMRMVLALNAWINGDDPYRAAYITENDVRQSYSRIALWILSGLDELLTNSESEFPETVSKLMLSLKDRLQFGVGKEAIHVAKMFDEVDFYLRRTKINILAEKNIDSLEDLLNLDPSELSQILSSRPAAELLHNKIRTYLEDPYIQEREEIRDIARPEGLDLIVMDLYTKKGKEYEVVVSRVFKLMGFHSELLDLGTFSTSKPDIRLTLNGRQVVCVECKTTKRSPLSREKVGTIYHKCLNNVQNPNAYLFVTNRGFHNQAVSAANSSVSESTPLSLLTNKSLCQLLLGLKRHLIRSRGIADLILRGGLITLNFGF